nr:hypothetical protein [Sunxiuqinia sp.]
MRNLSVSLFLFLVLVVPVSGQSDWIDSLHTQYDKYYGLDMLLHNGEKYVAEVNPVEGHPFWQGEKTFMADVYLDGKVFSNQKLRYHLHRQEFILSYIDYNQQPNQIVLNRSAIDSIRKGDLLFVQNHHPDIEQPLLQLIFKGELICYVGYKKDLNFHSQGSDIGYEYTEEICDYYLVYQDEVYNFRKKGKFLNIFPKEHRLEIRRFMSSQNLRFKSIDAAGLKKLVAYCEQSLMTK